MGPGVLGSINLLSSVQVFTDLFLEIRVRTDLSFPRALFPLLVLEVLLIGMDALKCAAFKVHINCIHGQGMLQEPVS